MKMLKSVCLLFIIIIVFECKGYAEFQDNGNGTVTDTETGLMWQQSTAALMTWENALQYCEDLPLAGHYNWRLPTIKELASIADYDERNPAIDTEFFPDTMLSYYWSSTTVADNTDYAWLLGFSFGIGTYNYKPVFHYARAVRSGQ